MRETCYVCVCVTWVERLTRAREGLCVAVKRLARLLSTIRQYNMRDTPGAIFAETMIGREGREGDCAEGNNDDEGVDFEQTLKSRQFKRGGSPHPSSRGFHRADSILPRLAIFTLVYRDDALPSLPFSLPPSLSFSLPLSLFLSLFFFLSLSPERVILLRNGNPLEIS